MREIDRSIKKKKQKTRKAKRNAKSLALLLSLGGGAVTVGMVLLGSGATMKDTGPASTIFFILGGLLILGGGLMGGIALLTLGGGMGQKRLVFRRDAVELVRGEGTVL